MNPTVVMYRTRFCPYCIRADALLRDKGVNFETVNVDGDAEKRAWLLAQTGSRTVPQIFIGDRAIGGCTELMALDRSGQLDDLLGRPAAP